MTLINFTLFIPALFKSFVVQRYSFFTFTIFCAIEIIAIIIAWFFNIKNYSFGLSFCSLVLFILTGLAVPYLIVSILRAGLIFYECKKLVEMFYILQINLSNVQINKQNKIDDDINNEDEDQ